MDTGLVNMFNSRLKKNIAREKWINTEKFGFSMSQVSKSLFMIGTVFGPKRRRTSSFSRRGDGVSYLELVNEGVIGPRKSW